MVTPSSIRPMPDHLAATLSEARVLGLTTLADCIHVSFPVQIPLESSSPNLRRRVQILIRPKHRLYIAVDRRNIFFVVDRMQPQRAAAKQQQHDISQRTRSKASRDR